MKITGTAISARTKEPLGEAKITLSVGTTEMASLYSDGKGYFAHEESTDYIGETLTCDAEKEGFKTKTLTHTIKEQIIPLEIAMEEEEKAPPPPPPPPIKKMLIGAGIGVVVLALVLVGVFVFIGNGKKPEIVSFTAAPSSINKGGASTLTWRTKHANEVASRLLRKRLPLSGSTKVSPRKTTTYTLVAMNKEGKKVSKNVTVKVKVSVAPRPRVFEMDPGIMRQRDHRKILEDQRPKTLR